MNGSELECLRSIVGSVERCALALERLAGIQPPPRAEPAPSRATGMVPNRVTAQRSEPVRGPVPMQRPAQGLPPPARRAPICNTEGPVFVGTNPVRCGLNEGHEGDHELAGFTWAPAAVEPPPPTEPGHEVPSQTEPPPAPVTPTAALAAEELGGGS